MARWEGRPIARIEFDPSQQPLPLEELNRLLPLKTGSPLHMDDVRAAIQKLYSTGRYSDVSIDVNPTDVDPADGSPAGPVVLRISTELNYFISGVNVAGESEPPNRSQLITASKQDLGAPFVESDLDRAIDNMQEKLRVNGLYNATIQRRVDLRPETEEANVYFDLDSGYRAHFDGVELAGPG